jgi:hypothetical protein
MDEATFDQWIPSDPGRWSAVLGKRAADTLTRAVQLLRDYFVGKQRVFVASHGDFTLSNLLFDGETSEITGVIDWSQASATATPLADGLNLMLIDLHDDNLRQTGVPGRVKEFIVQVLDDRAGPWIHERLRRVRSEYQLDRDDLLACLVQWITRYVTSRLHVIKRTTAWEWTEALGTALERATNDDGAPAGRFSSHSAAPRHSSEQLSAG